MPSVKFSSYAEQAKWSIVGQIVPPPFLEE